MINYCLVIAMIMWSVACKKQLSDPAKAIESLEGTYLQLSRQGLQVKIDNYVPRQKFYRLRLKRLNFSAEQVTSRIASNEAIIFSEVLFAFRDKGWTVTCQLEDVSQQLTAIDIEKYCHVQPEEEDYLRQFVEWCEDGADGKRSPWAGNWLTGLHCKRIGYTDIPAFCFTDNANGCFSNLSDEMRDGKSQLTNYLQNTSGQTFADVVKTIDDELASCFPNVIVGDNNDKQLYCKCGSSGKVSLAGKIRRCSRDPKSNAVAGFKYHYHLFDSYYLSPTGPYNKHDQ